jgi:hypothetical protein
MGHDNDHEGCMQVGSLSAVKLHEPLLACLCTRATDVGCTIMTGDSPLTISCVHPPEKSQAVSLPLAPD